ncbi:MAG: OadG family protein [Candidatus Heteroscillospira sp.]|jgi:Na+-transporting methylmalonyl-CoA/oxaloacetate decarboxylase gamma subunit
MEITIPQALGYSVLGFAIVFAALIILWGVIAILAKILGAVQNKAPAAAPAAAAAAAPVKTAPPAPGTAGEVKLFDVPDRQAAMIMAIVADKMQKPLNELRFKSIKEVK